MSWTPDQPQDPYQSPLSNAVQQPAWQAQRIKHSGLGIASSTLAVLSGLGMFVTIIVAGIMEASTPGGLDGQAIETVVIGLGIIGFAGLAFLGFGVGIAGLFQSDRNKLFSILGTVLNGLVVLGVCGIVGLGMAMQGM